MDILEYFQSTLREKRVHLYCDCLFKIDVRGRIIATYVTQREIFVTLIDEQTKKEVSIGLNTPSLHIELL